MKQSIYTHIMVMALTGLLFMACEDDPTVPIYNIKKVSATVNKIDIPEELKRDNTSQNTSPFYLFSTETEAYFLADVDIDPSTGQKLNGPAIYTFTAATKTWKRVWRALSQQDFEEMRNAEYAEVEQDWQIKKDNIEDEYQRKREQLAGDDLEGLNALNTERQNKLNEIDQEREVKYEEITIKYGDPYYVYRIYDTLRNMLMNNYNEPDSNIAYLYNNRAYIRTENSILTFNLQTNEMSLHKEVSYGDYRNGVFFVNERGIYVLYGNNFRDLNTGADNYLYTMDAYSGVNTFLINNQIYSYSRKHCRIISLSTLQVTEEKECILPGYEGSGLGNNLSGESTRFLKSSFVLGGKMYLKNFEYFYALTPGQTEGQLFDFNAVYEAINQQGISSYYPDRAFFTIGSKLYTWPQDASYIFEIPLQNN